MGDPLAEMSPVQQEQTMKEASPEPQPQTFDQDVGKKDEGSGGPQVVEVLVRKLDDNDKLGMDVKHVRGRLVIVQVFAGGALDRANQLARTSRPPGDTIDVGDVIAQVND